MRIISGNLKGRRFNPPVKIPARPTTDSAKEGLFNILTNIIDFESVSFLDLFGGTGSISYEMGSRGCTEIVCIEKDVKSVNFIRQTATEFQLPITVIQMDVFEYMRSTRTAFDVIFAGPPYKLDLLDQIPDEIFAAELLKPDGLFILEHNPHHNFDAHPHFKRKRNYGTTIFSIFEL
ncbi:MAG: RsmD family RNA methyltransferase [Chitinophagales bacterium]|nr:RsmD family RNA methyltransferase [Chitinophagales bacterium]MBP8753554.1 RsmD family RNA methyltransferase [Chitinophagales bacterium]MBP9188005.1 RsmD family RNA methyltransferase [Chitinophagales bacterium]MBP9704548.1 RsmD family RNA methyltransferase [Chitinophagales bacterium]